MWAFSLSQKRISVLVVILSAALLFSACENKASQPQTGSITQPEQAPVDAHTTDAPRTTVFGEDPYANIPAAVTQKGVSVLMWRPYTAGEEAAVKDFERHTGIKVTTTFSTESSYTKTLYSMIADQNAPDVFALSSSKFPELPIKALAPLDAETYRLEDAFWHQPYMEHFQIHGHHFGVAAKGGSGGEERYAMTFYFPDVLAANGITAMPYELYRQGIWNWDTQADIARKVGYALSSYDVFMLSAGADFIHYENDTFVATNKSVTISSPLVEAWYHTATLYQEKAVFKYQASDIRSRRVGLFTATVYSALTASHTFDDVTGGYANLQAVPVAGPSQSTAYTPADLMVWACPKGAKNPEGAAYFLRYFLDKENTGAGTYYNKQLEHAALETANSRIQVKTGQGAIDSGLSKAKQVSYEAHCNYFAKKDGTQKEMRKALKKRELTTGNVKQANRSLQAYK